MPSHGGVINCNLNEVSSSLGPVTSLLAGDVGHSGKPKAALVHEIALLYIRDPELRPTVRAEGVQVVHTVF